MAHRVDSFNNEETSSTRRATGGTATLNPRSISRRLPRNRSRSSLENSLHGDVTNEISEEVVDKVNATREVLLNQPIKSANSIFGSIVGKVKDVAHSFDENNDDPSSVRIKKYGSLIMAAGFALFATKSTFGLIRSMFNGDGSNKLVKLLDAGVKWVMAMGLGGIATNADFKFNKGSMVIGGTLVSVLLSQLSNFNSGQNNLLGKAAKMTGTNEMLNTALSKVGPVPSSAGNPGIVDYK